MPTLCASFPGVAEARDAVHTLLKRGVPGDDLRLLRGEPLRDARDAPQGSFAGGDTMEDPTGTFAGAAAPDRPEGSFAPDHDAHRERLGSFGDQDRDYAETFPAGVEDVSQVGHHRLVGLLAAAGVPEDVARRDVETLHAGRVLVLARVDDTAREQLSAVLSGAA
jgi:hypothetical protein